MDDRTKAKIEAGFPMVIAYFDKKGAIISQEAYNLENISVPDGQKEQLARATLEACRKFYSDPENVKEYEKWKAEREKKAKAAESKEERQE